MFETVLSDMSELCTQSVAEEDEADHRTEPPFRKPQRGRRVLAIRGTLINSDAATITDGIHGAGYGLQLLPGAGPVHQNVLPLGRSHPGGRI
jgi:hypothetical protein